MQARHAETSAQLVIAFVQPPFSKFGHMPMSQPIALRRSSSPPAAQVLSVPPQALAIPVVSFAAALAMVAAVLLSAWQSVAGGNLPLMMDPSHLARAFALDC